MFTLYCTISIGNYVFKHVNAIRIEASRKRMTDTCTLRLPRRYKYQNVIEVLKVGDLVKVQLGYTGRMNDEFTGKVLKIGCNTPVEIECEDGMYDLKRTEVKPKSWKTVKLKDIITYVAPGVVTEVPDISFSPYYIQGKTNAAKILENLKDQYCLDIYFRPDGKLYAGTGYWEQKSATGSIVNYNTELNVISQNLKFRTAESARIKLKLISQLPSGKIIKYEAGDPDGEVRTSHEYNKTMNELKAIAGPRLKSLKFDGLEGSIQTFGEPFCSHSMSVKIHDPIQPDHDGVYLVDTVNTSFGTDGFRRDIYLGKKLANA